MAFVDYENLYSSDQAITATAASENIIDHGDDSSRIAAYRELGKKSEVVAFVTEDFATNDGLTIALQSCNSSDFSSSAVTTHSSKLVALAALVKGAPIEIGEIPNDALQYTRLYYTVSGSSATAGKIHAGIGLDKQTNGIL
jgi:hypothetical protein